MPGLSLFTGNKQTRRGPLDADMEKVASMQAMLADYFEKIVDIFG